MISREITENGANIKLIGKYDTRMDFGVEVEDITKPYVKIIASRDGKELLNGSWGTVYSKINPVSREKLENIVNEMLTEMKPKPGMTQAERDEFDASRARIAKAMDL